MTLVYGGVDLSQYITKYAVTETPRIIEGPNKGTARNGEDIPDIIAVKIDPSFICRPLNPASIRVIRNLLRTLPTTPYKTLTYDSDEGSVRTINAKLTMSASTKVMDTADRTLYDGIVLVFNEK